MIKLNRNECNGDILNRRICVQSLDRAVTLAVTDRSAMIQVGEERKIVKAQREEQNEGNIIQGKKNGQTAD